MCTNVTRACSGNAKQRRDMPPLKDSQASGNITAAGLLLLIFVVWAPLIATFMDKVEPVLLSFFKESPGIQHLVQGVLGTEP